MLKKTGTNETPRSKNKRLASGGNRSQTSPPIPPVPTELAPSKTLPAGGPRSLMKTSQLIADRAGQRHPGSSSELRPSGPPARQRSASNIISGSRQQKIEERIAAATEELSGG